MAATVAKTRNSAASQRLYVVCLIHLVLCVVLLAETTPGSTPLTLGGVEIYHTLQCVNASVCCISIVCIILAAIGNLHLIESHLALYFYVLLISLFADLGWLLMFLNFGQSCKMVVLPDTEQPTATVDCAFAATGVVTFLILTIIFKVFGMLAVSAAKKLVRILYNEELLPYLKQVLCTSSAELTLEESESARLAFTLSAPSLFLRSTAAVPAAESFASPAGSLRPASATSSAQVGTTFGVPAGSLRPTSASSAGQAGTSFAAPAGRLRPTSAVYGVKAASSFHPPTESMRPTSTNFESQAFVSYGSMGE